MGERRSYTSPLRQSEAEATRKRIVGAAAMLFTRDGYGTTTMRAIADEAGVSVQTVNLQGPKSALLMAAYELALAQREGFTNLTDETPMQEIITSPDVEQLLDGYTAFMTAALGRIAELVRTLRAAADADPAVRQVYAEIEARRQLSLRDGVQRLVAAGALAESAIPEAVTMVGLLVSADTYLHLRDSGWSPERYRGWLRSQLASLQAQLSPESESRPTRRRAP